MWWIFSLIRFETYAIKMKHNEKNFSKYLSEILYVKNLCILYLKLLRYGI